MPGIFEYEVPKELIAQTPLRERAEARLMVVDRSTGAIAERRFSGIGEFFAAGDVLVLNDARVVPARLFARKETGGRVEVFLLRKREPCVWETLIRGRCRAGALLDFDGFTGRVGERTPDGSFLVTMESDDAGALRRRGRVPLPPYIRRPADEADGEYYQTVYAAKDGAVAAPTAGLHFTGELLDSLRSAGVGVAFLTLYIGWPSFREVRPEEEAAGRLMVEHYTIPAETAAAVAAAKAAGRTVCAVGTSAARALESAAGEGGPAAGDGRTDLFLRPGSVFKTVGRLVTNFHLPGSSHLHLVCAFGGTPLMERAYRTAVAERYRFYSYGDAMLIV